MKKVWYLFFGIAFAIQIAEFKDEDKVGMYGPEKGYIPPTVEEIPKVDTILKPQILPRKIGPYKLGKHEVEVIENP